MTAKPSDMKPSERILAKALEYATRNYAGAMPIRREQLSPVTLAMFDYLDEQHAAGQGEHGKRWTYSCSVCRLDLPHAHDPLVRFVGDHRYSGLACWCKFGELCHADVLLEIANSTSPAVPDSSTGGES